MISKKFELSNSLNDILLGAITKEEWDMIWSTTKARFSMWEASLGRKFMADDAVTFDIETGRNRGHYSGVIKKLGGTTAKVNVHGIEWTIGYSFLKKS